MRQPGAPTTAREAELQRSGSRSRDQQAIWATCRSPEPRRRCPRDSRGGGGFGDRLVWNGQCFRTRTEVVPLFMWNGCRKGAGDRYNGPHTPTGCLLPGPLRTPILTGGSRLGGSRCNRSAWVEGLVSNSSWSESSLRHRTPGQWHTLFSRRNDRQGWIVARFHAARADHCAASRHRGP